MTHAMTVKQARDEFLETNGFALADYDARWVKFWFGFLPVAFPNTRSRRKAVPLHDLHHVGTGYRTDVRGEAELAAWELAAGCWNNAAALFLNTSVAFVGLFISPRRVLSAFRRGRKGRTLYGEGFRNELLEMSLPELRAHMGVL